MSFVRSLLGAAVLCGLGSPGAGAADSPPPEKKETIALSPKFEAKIKDFITQAKVAKAKVWDERMQKEIAQIAKVTGLGDDGRKALEAPAKQTVADLTAAWAGKINEQLRKQLIMQPPMQASMMLDMMLSQVAAYAQMEMPDNLVMPTQQEGWLKAVHQVLTPDQAAAWDKAEAAHRDEVEKEIAESLKKGVDRTRDMQNAQMLSKCKEMELTLGLPKDRSDKLEDLAKTVVDQTTEMWRKRVDTMYLGMEDEQRKAYTTNDNIMIGTEKEEDPEKQAAWKDGLAHFLTADETTRLKTARDARKAQKEQVMAQIMIMLLDEKIAFTSVQRQKLQPLADRLVAAEPELFPEEETNESYSLPTGLFLSAAAKATDAELKPILDEVQLNRWHQLAVPDDGNDTAPAGSQAKPEETSEPEDVEKAISSYLFEKTEKERRHTLETNVLKAEDAARVADLPADIALQLQAAARGATEDYLNTWKWFVEQQVRGQLQDVTPDNVRQRLDSIQDYFFQRNFFGNFGQMNRENLWDNTVKANLNAKQQAAWKTEIDARAAFRSNAIAALVLASFDRNIQVTPAQSDKLQPLIAGIVDDYAPEISQIFSSFNGVPWYMQNGYELLPFAGVSDADLKAILTPDQIDRWHKTQEYNNSTSLWQNIQQNHDRRVKNPPAGGGVRRQGVFRVIQN